MDIAQRMKHVVVFSALLGAGYALPAVAQTATCTNINSIPTVITTQGIYCLNQHLSTNLVSGAAITINTNNVTIDCNDFKLGNLGAGPATSAIGISADSHMNVTVRNCGIRGFRSGIQLVNGTYQVENNRLDNNTQTGIFVSGDSSSIRRNDVIATGDSSIAGVNVFHGITTRGDVAIIDNNVTGVIATASGNGTVYGIRTEDMDASLIRGNRVRNILSAGSGARRGIWVQNGNRNILERNIVIMNGGMLGADVGIRCGDGLRYDGASRNNTVLGTGLVGELLGMINCTSVDGDFVSTL